MKIQNCFVVCPVFHKCSEAIFFEMYVCVCVLFYILSIYFVLCQLVTLNIMQLCRLESSTRKFVRKKINNEYKIYYTESSLR